MTPIETQALLQAICVTATVLLDVLTIAVGLFVIAVVYHTHQSGKSDPKPSAGQMRALEWDEERSRGDAVEVEVEERRRG